ncbi:MAG: hypothetical protein GC181_15105 [Bacteroidetes bacterium]|nr:hypothetical protein [Bacteroidota bacterium]
MKYLSLLLLLILSKFTTGQIVNKRFERTVLHDNFSYVSSRWEQRNTATESFITSDNKYIVKRLKDSYFAISLPNISEEYADFDLVALIEVEQSKENKNASGGIVLKAQKSGDGALILEINNNKEYRLRLMQKGKFITLLSNDNEGWIKSGNLKKKGANQVRIVTFGNEFDLYFNKQHERSFVETTFTAGKFGLFANAQSTLICTDINIMANEAYTEINENADKTYTELAQLFKTKIEKQQKDLDDLFRQLNECRSNLMIDTSAMSSNKTLMDENSRLKSRVNELETDLQKNKERLSYLESMKEDIEQNSNGDLIINLTELLAREKEKNTELQKENERLKKLLEN